MQKNYIAVLSNNMEFLETMLKNMTDKVKSIPIVVFNETRIGDHVADIEALLAKHGMAKSKVVDSKDVCEEFSKLLDNDSFLWCYPMGMNMLFLWYMWKHLKEFDNILYVDDDVILVDDLDSVFSLGKTSFFKADGLMKMAVKRDSYIGLTQHMIDISGKDVSVDEFASMYTSTGDFVVSVNDFDFELYEELLVKFFESDVVAHYFGRAKTVRGFHTDEMFMTSYVVASGLFDGDFSKHASHIITQPSKFSDKQLVNMFAKKSIVHIGNGKHKIATYDRLRGLGLIV